MNVSSIAASLHEQEGIKYQADEFKHHRSPSTDASADMKLTYLQRVMMAEQHFCDFSIGITLSRVQDVHSILVSENCNLCWAVVPQGLPEDGCIGQYVPSWDLMFRVEGPHLDMRLLAI